MRQWRLVTRLAVLRKTLRALMVLATPFAIVTAFIVGAALPVMTLELAHLRSNVVSGIVAVACAFIAAAFTARTMSRLTDRLWRLRAPIGTAAIGSDGIRWRHFRTVEFVPWREITKISTRGDNEVVLQTGRPTELVLSVEDAPAFAVDSRAALAKFRDAPPSDAIPALTLEGEVREWIARAGALLRSRSYRLADVSEEQCVRVALDPRAPASQRVGSSAALASASDDARKRVRVAIGETADPLLARALDDALEGRSASRAVAEVVRRAE